MSRSSARWRDDDVTGAAPRLDVGEPVELRTTHASWVYLGRDQVWKLKRPVDLGFLDFRTEASRRRVCEDEVRLNRRLAPEVYLGVLPVRRHAGGLTVAGDDPGVPIVDWAVHMRRLPDEAAAAALLARGRLDAAHLERLAQCLAAFHGAARETPAAGDVAAVRANVDENFAQTARFVGDLLERPTFDAARAFHAGWLAAHGDQLRDRVSERRVRDGHGDLRLEHVYFAAGAGPVVIDCLEFSDRLRCGDVASDAAFLAMELDAAGRHDLAAGFLARLAEASDDFGMYDVIDFYASYRACVRGKVAALVAVDPASPPATRSAKRREAQARFALALTYARRPPDAPFVVAVAGLPGSGKSTLAGALGRALALPVVSSDVTRKALAGLEPTARAPSELYTDASRDRTYAELFRRAAHVLGAGRSVILDATFSTRAWRAGAAALARAHGARLVIVERDEDPAVLRARLAARRGTPSVSDATDAELERIASRYEPPTSGEGWPLLRVRGDDAAREALAGLGEVGLAGPHPHGPA